MTSSIAFCHLLAENSQQAAGWPPITHLKTEAEKFAFHHHVAFFSSSHRPSLGACSRVSKPVSHPFTPAEVCSHLMLSSNKYFSCIPSFNKSWKFFRVPPYLKFFCYIFWGNKPACALRMQLQELRGVCGGKLESLQCRLGLVMLLHGSGHTGRISAAPALFNHFLC